MALSFAPLEDLSKLGASAPGIDGGTPFGINSGILNIPPENNTDPEIDFGAAIDAQNNFVSYWQDYMDSMKTPQASNSNQEDSGLFDSEYGGRAGLNDPSSTGVVDVDWYYGKILEAIKEQQLYNQNSANQAMAFEHQEAELNRQWQKMMSDTSYQRAVEDMKKAGLNPTLIGLGTLQGASTPSGSSVSGHQASMSSASGAFNSLMTSIYRNHLMSETTLFKNFKDVASVIIDLLSIFG